MNGLFVIIFIDNSRLTLTVIKVYTFFMRKVPLWMTLILLAFASFYLVLRYGIVFLNWIGISVSDAKTLGEILQSFVQILAIIVAGVWTYERFIRNREDYPYPKIEQRCEHHVLENSVVYLSVFVTVTNHGKTKLDLVGAKIIIRQVSPLSKEIKKQLVQARQNSREEDIRRGKVESLFVDNGQRLGWITLGSREWEKARGKINELEPGQTREYQFDFLLLEDNVTVIEAISYFRNEESAWELGTLYSLETQKK